MQVCSQLALALNIKKNLGYRITIGQISCVIVIIVQSFTIVWTKAHVFKEFLSNVYIRSMEGELFRASFEASREQRLIAAEQTIS